MITKKSSIRHSVTELGNLQVHEVTDYLNDSGQVVDKKFGKPMTPKDHKDMTGWDDKSKQIVGIVTDPQVVSDFKAEKKVLKKIGIEEIITTDRTIEDDDSVAVRKITRIFDDGKEMSKKYHRSWIMPGDDCGKADAITKAVATTLHTQDAIDIFIAKRAAKG